MAGNSELSSYLFSIAGFHVQWPDLLLLATVVASWAALGGALVLLRNVKKQSQETLAMVQDLNRDVQVAGRGAIGMGQRIIALERKLASHGISAVVNSGETSAEIKPFATHLKTASTPHLRPVPSPSNRNTGADVQASEITEDPTPFDQASQLLASGMDVEEVAQRCGLSRSEAALMAMLQRQKGVIAL